MIAVWKRPYAELRFLAQRISEQPGSVGAFASTTDQRVVFFKNPKNDFDLRQPFQKFLQIYSVRGGGPSHLMEAGGFRVENDFENSFRAIWEE
jgi:hypothetical protein